MSQRSYIVPPAVFAPISLTILALVLAFALSWWSLVAIPFIWLGAFGSSPNLNLGDGCLPFLSIYLGLFLIIFFKSPGIAIAAGTALGYFLSSYEKYVRMYPTDDD